MNLNRPEDPATEPASKSSVRSAARLTRFWAWFGRHPLSAILAVSALAVIINCYPIIFCGKSYVSPICVNQALVYDRWPPLPGMPYLHRTLQHDSDTGAMMWWGVPLGFIESHSIWDHGAIPLWNRYGHAGDPLLGQAVSMIGDPLQLIVIAGRGSAMAWDLKFLIAKLLFCLGFGWLVLRLFGNLAFSLIFTLLAAYSGAYIFIDNHPAFFVFTYAPWILLSVMAMLARPLSDSLRWGFIWLLANIGCFNGGHVELAVTLIGGLNLAGLTFSLISCRGILNQTKLLLHMMAGVLLFLGLTAPVWVSFLTSLKNSYSVHADIKVTQLPPTSFPGMFDDLFYHLLPDYYNLRAPGTSLLVFVGCLFSLLRWRRLKSERFFWVNTGAIILWAGCVFGGVPAAVITAIPFLNRVGHIQTDFSYLLVIHLTLQSAYGFTTLLKKETFQTDAVDYLLVGLAMPVMLAVFCICKGILTLPLFIFHPLHPFSFLHLNYLLPAMGGAIGAPLLFTCLKSRHGRVTALGWVAIALLAFIPNVRFGLYQAGDEDLLMLPGPREVLNPSFPALHQVKSQTDPFRAAGMGWNLIGDYSAVYAIEDIRSCAPLSNAQFIQLVQNFPGMILTNDWVIEIKDPGKAHPLLNLLNVKYLLADPHTFPLGSDQFSVTNYHDFTVLDNPQAWPRAFFANEIVSASSNDEFTRYLLRHGDRPFVALDQAEADRQPELRQLETETSPAIIPAEHYQLLPNSTAFDIQTTAAGVVCLTEEQAGDFLARANNRPVQVFTVNRAFKGIFLEKPGNYHVEFCYRPHFWRLSCSLFCLSAGIVLILPVTESLRQRSHPVHEKQPSE
jgi:hypothetical protein